MIIERGVLWLVLMLVALTDCQIDDVAPDVTVVLRPLRPKGLQALIKGVGIVAEFVFFDGKTYLIRNSTQISMSSMLGVAVRQYKGGDNRWLFENYDVELEVGMVIKYRVFVPNVVHDLNVENEQGTLTFDGVIPDYKDFIVKKLFDRIPFPSPGRKCKNTVTKVLGRRVCAGDVIFEDNFDTFQTDVWQIEQYIPTDHPEHPFVSYQNLTADPNVFVRNGSLHIVPKLLEDFLEINQSIETGSLDLGDRCTRRQCSKTAFGPDILPPIVSGQVTSLPFAFTYGIVTIRAKSPRGDWLYPDFLVEPFLKKYDGIKELAAVMKVSLITEFISNIYNLESNKSCYDVRPELIRRIMRDEHWKEDFHEYVLKWTPDEVELSVDSHVYIRSNMTTISQCIRDELSGSIPNFNDYRQLSLSVAAGGTHVFIDFAISDSGYFKPYLNGDAKASLKFWQSKYQWLPTWTAPSLEIDYVKVVAL
ncbi:beta-1,3-glucan-binding protein-like [Bicyclus anynana]|uniref:Beta-1,3-glucan-binding protein-like n=1 Tax=Bicyclus anynana TaxID=110368 RepID=A0ABM3LRV2_BICAN|nr:beta-1,3-glucan-binding protein-like [Bicyclus anynana]